MRRDHRWVASRPHALTPSRPHVLTFSRSHRTSEHTRTPLALPTPTLTLTLTLPLLTHAYAAAVFFSNRGVKAIFSAAVGCAVLPSGTGLFGQPGKEGERASGAVETVTELPMTHDDLIGAIRKSTQGL